MSKQICPDGPFNVDLSILFLDDEGNEARVTYGFPKGTYPTRESVAKGIAEAVAAVPDGFKIANRHEFIRAELGLDNVAIPGPVDFVQ